MIGYYLIISIFIAIISYFVSHPLVDFLAQLFGVVVFYYFIMCYLNSIENYPPSGIGIIVLELPISLLIIGILIATAIPFYQSYLESAKISEALCLMGGAKSHIVEYYSFHGNFPDNLEQLGVVTKGNYTHITINNGAMTATLNSGNQNISGLSLCLRPAFADNGYGLIAWVCGYAQPHARFIVQGENQTNIPRHYLSSTCR